IDDALQRLARRAGESDAQQGLELGPALRPAEEDSFRDAVVGVADQPDDLAVALVGVHAAGSEGPGEGTREGSEVSEDPACPPRPRRSGAPTVRGETDSPPTPHRRPIRPVRETGVLLEPPGRSRTGRGGK